MKRTALLSLFFVFLSSYSIASIDTSNNKTIHLGTVNGRVVNEQTIEIKNTLTDPVLFRAVQAEWPKKLTRLDIHNAKIIADTEENIIIDVKDETKNIHARLTLEQWVDGKRTNIQGKTNGSDVYITVPNNVNLIELRTHRPIVMFVPRSYRGDFKLLLDIAGWSE